jgi:DNA-directed RNA polymerase subunit RPC12/RpoP
MQFDFKALTDFTDHFCDEEVCVKHYTAVRFADGEYCAHCGHREIYSFKGGKRYRCAACKKDFTIKTGTLFWQRPETYLHPSASRFWDALSWNVPFF